MKSVGGLPLSSVSAGWSLWYLCSDVVTYPCPPMSLELCLLRLAEDLPRLIYTLSLLKSQHAGILKTKPERVTNKPNFFIQGGPGGQSCAFGKGLHMKRAKEHGKHLGMVAARALHRGWACFACSWECVSCRSPQMSVWGLWGEWSDGSSSSWGPAEQRWEKNGSAGCQQGMRNTSWAPGDGGRDPNSYQQHHWTHGSRDGWQNQHGQGTELHKNLFILTFFPSPVLYDPVILSFLHLKDKIFSN